MEGVDLMRFIETTIEGLRIIQPKVAADERGFLVKVFHHDSFFKENLSVDFRESFYSVSRKNVIRGMHFQLPQKAHHKLVYVISGDIVDGVVDLRKESVTYRKTYTARLSHQNKKALYIPPGIAHGFGVMSDSATVVYMTSTVHSPEHDSGINWDGCGIDWQISAPIVSERDSGFVSIDDFVSPF